MVGEENMATDLKDNLPVQVTDNPFQPDDARDAFKQLADAAGNMSVQTA